MTHQEFTTAYAAGHIKVTIDPVRAGRFVSGRLMLPFLLLPLFGLAVGLALMQAWPWAVAVLITAYALRHAVRASSPGFVLRRALADAAFYGEAQDRGLLRLGD